MGPKSDPMAVVDNQLMVHDIDGIRVMDASAMPIIVSGNTHATIVMMAERGVEFIKKRWLSNTVRNRGEQIPRTTSNSYVVKEAITFKPTYHDIVKPSKGNFQQTTNKEHYFNSKPESYNHDQYKSYYQPSIPQAITFAYQGLLNPQVNVK